MRANFVVKTIVITFLTLPFYFLSCSSKDDSSDLQIEDEDRILTMSGKLAMEVTTLTASLSDHELYCVTFESSPQAASSSFDEDGAFSIEVRRGINFGCFVNVSSDNSTIATFVVAGVASPLGGGAYSALALSDSVDLGELTIGDDGRVVIPASRLANVTFETESEVLVVDDLHNSEYAMSCVDAGPSENFAQCKDILLGGEAKGQIYMRIIKGSESNGRDLLGFGGWRSKKAFDDCGGFDLNEELTEKDGVTLTLSQGEVGEWGGTDCELRDEGDEMSRETIHGHYLLGELVKSGGGYSVRDEYSQDQGGGCVVYRSVAIDFSGETDEMFGAFSLSTVRSNCDFVEGEQNFQTSFLVKFVPVD